MYTPQEVKIILEDYNWMLDQVESYIVRHDSTGIAQYGVEASLPKPQGATTDKVYNLVSKEHGHIATYSHKINFITEREHLITRERDKYILHLLKKGYSQTHIALLVQLNKGAVSQRVKAITEILAKADEQNEQICK